MVTKVNKTEGNVKIMRQIDLTLTLTLHFQRVRDLPVEVPRNQGGRGVFLTGFHVREEAGEHALKFTRQSHYHGHEGGHCNIWTQICQCRMTNTNNLSIAKGPNLFHASCAGQHALDE